MLQRSKILFLVLFLAPLVQLSAQERIEPLKRRISIQMDSTNVETILEKLVSDNELFFSYNPDLLPAGKLNFSVVDTSLGEILKTLLPDSLFSVNLIDRQLIITRVEPKPLKISGRVVEKDGKTPVFYASVIVEGTYIGTMTNHEGNFDLNIPYLLRNNNIIISSVGYKQKIISAKELAKVLEVKLQDESIQLREILVKPADPRYILQQFRSNIVKNYPDELQLMVTFYRETARQDGIYVGVWEAAMEILKPPYQFNEPDRVRFIKGRKADLNRKPKEVLIKVQGGPLGINSLDVVKYAETFLDPEYEYLYQYRFEQPEIINGRITWIIRFDRLAETEFPCFNGKLWIDADSYALVGAAYSYDKKSLKINGQSFIQKEPFGFDTRPENVEYSVQYRLLNDKWQFYSAHSDITFRVKQKKKFKTEYRNVTDVLVTQQYPFPKRGRFGPEGIFHEKDIFSEKIGIYDKEFWGNYNVIKPDDDLIKAVKEANIPE
ncbi:MAG: carboxypeptidase-like regulatory domain-containing protein [Bacteroidia bacterium]|nr:carboxypeptidase-like regulatory domain-containing protein [Bacteroidia bacterium]